jgi:alpha-mannosidase
LEFNQDWDFSQGRDPTFIVGQGDPKKGWSRFHPGPADPGSGQRVHPFTVLFDLGDTPRGVFFLTIDVMFYEPLIPQYVVEINGSKGRYYFRPTLSYEIGDPSWFDNIILSNQRLRIPIPAVLMRKGKNSLVLRCLGESGEAILPESSAIRAPSGIYYDALGLSHDATINLPHGILRAEARPTIFYRKGADGRLRELVTLETETSGGLGNGKATLQLAGQSYSCDLPSQYDFGERQCAVAVPEFRASASGKLTIHLGGRSRTFEVSLAPQKKWTLFEAPHNHLDPGYTDYRPKSYEVHNRNIDHIVEAIESNPQYRFNPDGAFIFQDYWAHRSKSWQERVLKLLREGRLALPAQLFTLDTGGASQEELIRLNYYSGEMGRAYGISVDYLNQTDPPAHTWSLPSIVQGIGVKYIAIACDQYRGPILSYGRLNEESPFWWEGPDGKKALTWFARHYIQMGFLFGREQPIPQAGVTSLPIFMQAYNSPDYMPDAVMLFGTQSDNAPFNPEEVGFADKWNKEFAYPRIVVATMAEFFRYMEQNFASSFPTLRGDGGAWWEEMYAADALYEGISRRTKERIPAAEVAASLGALVNKGFPFPLSADRELWEDSLLYTEHSMGGAPRSWMRPEMQLVKTLFRAKHSFIEQAEIGADNMLRRGLSQLADRIHTMGDTLVLFNPLSWKRGGLVEVDLPRGYGLVNPETQQGVPLELMHRIDEEDYDRVRFWADETPALGYRCYAISSPSSAQPAEESSSASQSIIENSYYRVTVDPSRGGIASIYDKQLGRELVDQHSPYVLNQYVYAGYGHEGVSLIRQRTKFNSTLLSYSTALPRPDLKVTTGGAGKVVAVRKAAWGTILLLESSEAHTPKIEAEIRLFDQVKRIELVNTVHKEVVRSPEGVYFAFPLAAQNPTIRYEIQNGWVDPTRDQLPGANKEWFSAQHWVAVTDSTHTIGLALIEAPLFALGDIVRGCWPKSLEIRNGTVFSYIMDNYDGDDERPFQGGAFTFRYALTSAAQFDPAGLARFGREEASPLEFDKVTASDKRNPAMSAPTSLTVWQNTQTNRQRTSGVISLENQTLPPGTLDPIKGSFIDVDPGEVTLTTWKGAEDGEGYILRLYNTQDRPVEASIAFPQFQFDQAYRCNLLEVNQEALDTPQGRVVLSLAPHEIGSIRVTGFRLK